jgi:hypothetical protein
MRALCPECGERHAVVHVHEEDAGDARKDVFQVAPLGGCDRTWLTEADLLEASARFEQEAITDDDDEDDE